ncbi:MAG TPA: hypothetical protein VHD32_05130 [Candidatus Didemnitutus sp.]|nr:hypothetical protein [Candidatus Didemnitutus sp.]
MTLRTASALAVILVSASGRLVGASAPVEIDPGLRYVRVHSLETDGAVVEKACATGTPLILDVRFASAKEGDGALFARDLSARAGDEPLFVLVSPSTPAAMASALSGSPRRLITLGVADSTPPARVVIVQTAEADRRAYDAAESGKDLAKLISGKVDKDRYDEASLVSDFNNGNSNPELPPSPDPRQAKENKTAPLVDRVLQRAVHLYRALTAVKPRS